MHYSEKGEQWEQIKNKFFDPELLWKKIKDCDKIKDASHSHCLSFAIRKKIARNMKVGNFFQLWMKCPRNCGSIVKFFLSWIIKRLCDCKEYLLGLGWRVSQSWKHIFKNYSFFIFKTTNHFSFNWIPEIINSKKMELLNLSSCGFMHDKK